MKTQKSFGCGGRYSSHIFCPCELCEADTLEQCKAILMTYPDLKPHYEYWVHPTKKHIIKSHGVMMI